MNTETYCEICGKKTNFGGETCSRECAGNLKKKNNREVRTCKVCNASFIVKKITQKTMCSDKCRAEWASKPENIKDRLRLAEQATMEIYGVKSSLELKEVREKGLKTKQEKYGNEFYVNVDKVKKTKAERYGDENYNNHTKSKETKLERYGDENYNNREKATETMLDLYGVTHAMKREDFQNKAIKTNNILYNADYAIQNPKVKQKAENTCLIRYGTKNPSQNEEVKEKIKSYHYNQFPETILFEKMKINNLELIGDYIGMREDNAYRVYNFKCTNCNDVFMGTFSNNRPPICRKCFPLSQNSNYHLDFKYFLSECVDEYSDNNRFIIKPYELDFYIPGNNLAIELNGNYYHSEIGGGKDRKYHIRKSILCLEQGIKLLHIFEDEWIYKKDIVKSRIRNMLNISHTSLYARNCSITYLSEKEKFEFLELNHIQGNSKDSIRIGLKHGDDIVSVMTFIKLRKGLGNKNDRGNIWELVRFCSKINTNVIGGFGKILKEFTKKNKPEKIVTYADMRWSGLIPENTVYHKSGFSCTRINPPRYWYFEHQDYYTRHHRFKFRKTNIIKLLKQQNLNVNLSEWEMAQLLKMDRIWDCGTMRFELNP